MSRRALPSPPGGAPKQSSARIGALPVPPQEKSSVENASNESVTQPEKPTKPQKPSMTASPSPSMPPRPTRNSISEKPPQPTVLKNLAPAGIPDRPVKPSKPTTLESKNSSEQLIPPKPSKPAKPSDNVDSKQSEIKGTPTISTRSIGSQEQNDQKRPEPPKVLSSNIPPPPKPPKVKNEIATSASPSAYTPPPKPSKPSKPGTTESPTEETKPLPTPPIKKSSEEPPLEQPKGSPRVNLPKIDIPLGVPEPPLKKLPISLKNAIEKKEDPPVSPGRTESKTKGKRPISTKIRKQASGKAGTLRFFSSKSKSNIKEIIQEKEPSMDDIGISKKEEAPLAPSRTEGTEFSRNSLLIAQALAKRNSGVNIANVPPPPESKTTLLNVSNTFSKSRVARVEFGPENISKSIEITTRTSPLEAFEGMMNKMSKGLPPERRDTLVAKYAKYTLYRQFEDGELEQIYSDEPLLSPMQIMGSTGPPKFLFTDQKVNARTREGSMDSLNLGSVLQETHMKEEKKAGNAVDEILITERKFLFDTDLILEMVLKPICEEDIIPVKTRNKIFLNIQQINSFHRELYRRFQIDNSISGIAAVFSDDIIQYMCKVYTTYLGYYENALTVFYNTRDHSEKFRKFLNRLSAESPVFKDKSLNNLLVTPMQRVCKYELLLRNVISQEKKRPNPDQASIKALKKIMNQLNVTLQRIDKRRVESDDWEKILLLEEKLCLSEPLRKRGRIIVAEGTFKTTRRLLTGNTVSRSCSVVLFNDILLRAYKSNKTGQFKVLDISPLNHLVLVDPYQTYSNVPNTITMCNFDPRGAVLEFYFPSEEERQEWYQFLVKYTIPMSRVCAEWGIPKTGLTGKETIYAVDNCAWYEAYIERCRILVTRNYVILAWEAFGITQKEIIPFENITDIEGSKDAGEILKTNLWKENYRLKKFNNYSTTSVILRSVWQTFRRENKSSVDSAEPGTPRTVKHEKASSWTRKISLSSSEMKSVWSGAKKKKVAEGDVVLDSDIANDSLFMVVKGLLVQTDSISGEINILGKGEMFGVASFLNDSALTRSRVTGGQGGATYASMTRDEVYKNLSSQPMLLAKLFSTLARSLT